MDASGIFFTPNHLNRTKTQTSSRKKSSSELQSGNIERSRVNRVAGHFFSRSKISPCEHNLVPRVLFYPGNETGVNVAKMGCSYVIFKFSSC